jgi:hypothetical protein
LNYIEEAEKYLRNYRHLRGSVETMRRERERLIGKAGPRGEENMAIALDAVGGGRGSAGEYDDAINLIWRIRELTENIQKTEERLKEIDRILEEISEGDGCEFYGRVLRAWYIDGIAKEDIAAEIGYESRTSIYTIRNRAIRKFAVRVLGIRALEAM